MGRKMRASWLVPAPCTFIVIGVTNLFNVRKSPRYHDSLDPAGGSREADSVDYLAFGFCISAKSLLYGLVWPLSWMCIASSATGTRENFRRHFIPFSRYGYKNQSAGKNSTGCPGSVPDQVMQGKPRCNPEGSCKTPPPEEGMTYDPGYSAPEEEICLPVHGQYLPYRL